VAGARVTGEHEQLAHPVAVDVLDEVARHEPQRVDLNRNGSGKRTRGGILTVGPITPSAGTLLISEFRLRGPSGANDEFIEIYNNSGASHTVTALSGTGYAIAASDGVVRCTIPNGTVIPAGGHYLCTNSVAYSLSANATGDATGRRLPRCRRAWVAVDSGRRMSW